VREWVVVHFPAAVFAASSDGTRLWQPSVRMLASEIQGAAGAGDALASGVLYGVHEDWPMIESLQLGVACAASSLMHPTCSEGVVSRAECLALARRFGFHDA
jgi:sugar/nucleoside kinase (ribokinase family)